MNYREIRDESWEYIYLLNDINPKIFFGKVLYVGIGGGYMYRSQSNKVSYTVFIEKDLVKIKDLEKEYPNEKLNILQGDAYTITISEKFDYIILDIWDHPIDYQKVKELFFKFNKNLTKKGKLLYMSKIIKNKT